MPGRPILSFIKQLNQPVFTTHDLSAVSGKSLSGVTQALNFLQREGIVFKIYRGLWSEAANEAVSPCAVVPFLLPRHRAYVSFLSALHLHGIIEQIPQVITLASTAHSKIIRTEIAAFSIHRISPAFFKGFNWYKGTGGFLIAGPEKALIDCLYVSACRKKQFAFFPELRFTKSFSFRKAREWVKEIPSRRIRVYAQKKLEALERNAKNG